MGQSDAPALGTKQGPLDLPPCAKTLQDPCSQPCFQAVEASTMTTFKASTGCEPSARSWSPQSGIRIGCLVTQSVKGTFDLQEILNWSTWFSWSDTVPYIFL